METSIQARNINSVILRRKSIYPYQFDQEKKIEDSIIWQILENANRAPNHKQTEPWRFSVFSGEGLKYFGNLQAELYKRYAGTSFSERRLEKLLEYPLLSSHVISIGMKRNETNKLPEIEEIEAVACAVQNMFLTVTAYGMGSYWSSAGITYFEQAKPYFGLDNNDKLLGFFYIGHLKDQDNRVSKRKPIRDKVRWINNNNGFE